MRSHPGARRAAGHAAAVAAAVAPAVALAAACLGPAWGCSSPSAGYVEEREPCAERRAERAVFFGDLHLHTDFSFDAYGYGSRASPADAYDFARGAALGLPPLDADGRPTREVRLDRPLDFAMVSDHAEFLGETGLCSTPGSAGWDSEPCRLLRAGEDGVTLFGVFTSLPSPRRARVCADGGTGCIAAVAAERWQALERAAEAAYDRSAACGFVSFVGYEYTNTLDVANVHRHVVFGNERVPARPATFYEAQSAVDLWRALERDCLDAGSGCVALSIAHNSILSNGHETGDTFVGAASLEERRALAALRARVEPLFEIHQHKGAAECRNGSWASGPEDPRCDFEQVWPATAPDCGEDLGSAGMRLSGCLSRHDFLRQILLDGLAAEAELGVNPFPLGVVGSTDTHNATAGLVAEWDFPGHVGTVDDTPAKRLGAGDTVTHDTVINNPGGLAAVWAEERSRSSIFDALRRREVYATSGPRIELRLFGGWGYEAGLCAQDATGFATRGYAGGVPMGAALPARPDAAAAPTLAVRARRDPGVADHPGAPLARLQIVKGAVHPDGTTSEQVFDVAVDPAAEGASVDPATCAPPAVGQDELCAVWTDPGFDPADRAYYYARALEVPTCRWSAWECLRLAPADRPAPCDDPAVPRSIEERAWSSPIWYSPGR